MKQTRTLKHTELAANLACGGGLCLLLLITFLAAFQPLFRAESEHSTRIDSLRSVLSATSNASDDLSHLKVLLARRRDMENARWARLPRSSEESQFLDSLHRIASQNELRLADFQRGQVSEKQDYSELAIGVSGDGSFAAIARFLAQLEGMNRLASARDFQIIGSPKSTSYSFRLTIVVYFVGEGQA